MPAITLPYDFVGGTRAIADQVDANFAALVNAFATSVRTVLNSNTTFYVAPGGADIAGNGLSQSTPAATIQFIIDLLQAHYDLNWNTATIQLANGTYNQSVALIGQIPGLQAAARLVIQGNLASPNLVTWTGDPCFGISNGGLATVQGMTLQSSVSHCIIAQTHARVLVLGVIFGTTLGSHMFSARGASIQIQGNYTIAGSANAHVNAVEAGEIFMDPPPGNYMGSGVGAPVITLTGTPAWGNAFAIANNQGCMRIGATFSGGATGVRARANYNGVIMANGLGPTYLPGDQAPVTSLGGVVYV